MIFHSNFNNEYADVFIFCLLNKRTGRRHSKAEQSFQLFYSTISECYEITESFQAYLTVKKGILVNFLFLTLSCL